MISKFEGVRDGIVSRIQGTVNLSDKVLSVGEGQGHLARSLIDLGLDVQAVDISTENIRAAQDKGVVIQEASATELPFDENSFDVLLFNESIGAMPIEEVLKEAHRVLKPNGTLIISDLWVDNLIINDTAASLAQYIYRPISKISQVLKESGFSISKLEPIPLAVETSQYVKGLFFITASADPAMGGDNRQPILDEYGMGVRQYFEQMKKNFQIDKDVVLISDLPFNEGIQKEYAEKYDSMTYQEMIDAFWRLHKDIPLFEQDRFRKSENVLVELLRLGSSSPSEMKHSFSAEYLMATPNYFRDTIKELKEEGADSKEIAKDEETMREM